MVLCPVLSPIPDAGKGEGEEDEEKDGMRLGLPTTSKNCIPRRRISVLEKLVKTCPVWLQLGLGQAEAAKILQWEVAGVSELCPPQIALHRLGCMQTAAFCSSCLHLSSFVWNQWWGGEACAGRGFWGIQTPEIQNCTGFL